MIMLLAITRIFSKSNCILVIYDTMSNVWLTAPKCTLRMCFIVNSRNTFWTLRECSVIANPYLKVVAVQMASRI